MVANAPPRKPRWQERLTCPPRCDSRVWERSTTWRVAGILIKASAPLVKTWIISDQRTYTDLWGSKTKGFRSLDSQSKEESRGHKSPLCFLLLAAQGSSLHRGSHLSNSMCRLHWDLLSISVMYTSTDCHSGICNLDDWMKTVYLGFKCSGTLMLHFL